MTGSHWFWLAVAAANAVGIYPTWQDHNPWALLCTWSCGYALATLFNLPPKSGVGTPTPEKESTP